MYPLTDYATNLAARQAIGLKIKMNLTEYYKHHKRMNKLDEHLENIKHYIHNIDEIFAPEKRQLFCKQLSYNSNTLGWVSKEELNEKQWLKRKNRNLHMANQDWHAVTSRRKDVA